MVPKEESLAYVIVVINKVCARAFKTWVSAAKDSKTFSFYDQGKLV